MDPMLVIRGKLLNKAFVADEPMPEVEGRAELIVYVQGDAPKANSQKSASELFGKAARLRSGEDIERQVQDERRAWNGE